MPSSVSSRSAATADAVAALGTMTASTSTVFRVGQRVRIPSAELVRGDVLVLGEGDAVGADARIISASALRIMEASLTGESEAADKDPATLSELLPLGDRRNMLFKGTAVTQGVGRALVTATGMDTEMGAIATMLDSTVEKPTPLQKEIGFVGRMLGIIVIAIAIVVMSTITVVEHVTTLSGFITVLLLGVSLAVAAVPEGLPAVLAVVLAIGVQRLAKNKAIVKKLSSVETLGSASIICTDKTGTLTRNEMTIQKVQTYSGTVELTGTGYRPDGTALHDGAPITDPTLRYEAQLVLGAGSLANNAQLIEQEGQWRIQGDPTEAAFLVAARKLKGTGAYIGRFERESEIPFTSERRLMSTVQREINDGTVLVFTKGAPDVLLGRCDRVQVGESAIEFAEPIRQRALADVDLLTSQAYRTLGVAYRAVASTETPGESTEYGLVFAGLVGIIDPPRSEVAPAIAEAHRAGIRTIMITGDHPATAARIATDLGIASPGTPAMTGQQLDALDAGGLRQAARTISVFARVAPRHKLLLVDGLQADGHIVAMTGDGVNDAPALKSADIGIAMGITGTEVTREAATMILADDNVTTIVAAVRQGRVIFDNIKKFLRYLLSSNTGEVLTVFLGVVFAGAIGLSAASSETIVLPLLATQILWINLITQLRAGPRHGHGSGDRRRHGQEAESAR